MKVKDASLLLLIVMLIAAILVRAAALQIVWSLLAVKLAGFEPIPYQIAVAVFLIAALIFKGDESSDPERPLSDLIQSAFIMPVAVVVIAVMFYLTMRWVL